MDSGNAGGLLEELSRYFSQNPPGNLTVDMEKVTYLDDFGTLVLIELRKIAVKGNGDFNLRHPGEKIREMLVQLEQFGANIYVASLVGLSMTRELGPIMTAIIVAGRSGSAFAAEIGTMKISEEVDALFTMGFDPVGFLVIPKLIAALVMVPILTLFSDIFAITGGLLVGVFMLDLTPGAYVAQTIHTLTLFDVFWGVFKSGIFGLLITWVGCLRGFQVSGGAASVGQATTSAVVSSIFLVILFDSIFSVILRYTG